MASSQRYLSSYTNARGEDLKSLKILNGIYCMSAVWLIQKSWVAQVNPQVSHQQLVPNPCSTSTRNPMGLPVKTSPRTSKSAKNWGSYGWFYWILQNQLQLPQFWSKNYVFRIIWKLTGRAIQTSALHMLPIPVTCAGYPSMCHCLWVAVRKYVQPFPLIWCRLYDLLMPKKSNRQHVTVISVEHVELPLYYSVIHLLSTP